MLIGCEGCAGFSVSQSRGGQPGVEMDHAFVGCKQFLELVLCLLITPELHVDKRQTVVDPDVSDASRIVALADKTFPRLLRRVAGEHGQAGTSQAIAGRVFDVSIWIVSQSRACLRNSIDGDWMGSQKLRSLACQRARLSSERLEKLRHAFRIEA